MSGSPLPEYDHDRLNSLEDDLKLLVKTVSNLAGAVDKTNLNVDHIDTTVQTLAVDLRKINNKEFNWGNFMMAIGLLGAFWAAAIQPLEQNDQRNADEITKLEGFNTTMLQSRFTDIDGKKLEDELKNSINRAQARQDMNLNNVREEVKELRSIVISHQLGDHNHN